jgi:NADH dehydrogenase (ubiquinone) 1 alpha subcomplex subunit 8
MSVTNEAYLPTVDEIYVPPLNLSSAPLKAGAFHFGKYCFNESNVS